MSRLRNFRRRFAISAKILVASQRAKPLQRFHRELLRQLPRRKLAPQLRGLAGPVSSEIIRPGRRAFRPQRRHRAGRERKFRRALRHRAHSRITRFTIPRAGRPVKTFVSAV